MFKSPTSKDLTNLVNTAGAKISDAGKKTAESEKIKKTTNFLGSSSKEVINECRKIVSNITLNVSLVVAVFFLINSAFIVYGIYLVATNFVWMNLLLVLGLIFCGVTFSVLAAYRSYKYAQFKIGLGIYDLLESFFKMLINTSIQEIEKGGKETLKTKKITGLLKKNGSNIIQTSAFNIPRIVRKPVFLFIEFVPFGDIIFEVLEESKRKATGNVEDQVMKKLNSHIAALTPQKKFTRFVGWTLVGNVTVMGLLVFLMQYFEFHYSLLPSVIENM